MCFIGMDIATSVEIPRFEFLVRRSVNSTSPDWASDGVVWCISHNSALHVSNAPGHGPHQCRSVTTRSPAISSRATPRSLCKQGISQTGSRNAPSAPIAPAQLRNGAIWAAAREKSDRVTATYGFPSFKRLQVQRHGNPKVCVWQ